MKTDEFGDRMKEFESQETNRKFLPMLPIYARIDGRGFSKFTKDMERPFDVRMTNCMIDTAKQLVAETHALMGYTQSDEISLVWYSSEYKTDVFFNRKIQKLASVLAGLTTAAFIKSIFTHFADAEKYLNMCPHFDARVISLPTLEEATNMMLWREMDATKNAVSMAAHSMFSHKSLQNKSGPQMQERMFKEKGINFNDYPDFFKRGTFVKRVVYERSLTEQELEKIPERKRPGPGALFTRSKVEKIEMPRFSKVVNRVKVIFEGQQPEVETA
jgi:tRNA(His) guanylyltransferase